MEKHIIATEYINQIFIYLLIKYTRVTFIMQTRFQTNKFAYKKGF